MTQKEDLANVFQGKTKFPNIIRVTLTFPFLFRYI